MVLLNMTDEEGRGSFVTIARAMTAQENREIGSRMNDFESTMTLWLRDFVRMNAPTFLGSKVGEDPKASWMMCIR